MQERIPRIGVGVFVLREGKFLMGKRKNAHGDGSWSVPGGHLEFGETFQQTAEREVLEETGMSIRDIRFAAVTNDFFPDEQKHYVTIWMLSTWGSGEPQICEPDKYTDLQWCDFDSLPTPLFLPWNQLLGSAFLEDIKYALDPEN